MPTRILLNEAVTSSQKNPRLSLRTQNNLTRNFSGTDDDVKSVAVVDGEKICEVGNKSNLSKRKSSRKVVQLKSSIIRGKRESGNFRALSSEDIRASPRLLGYCFQLLASIVMLISVSTFYSDEADSETASPEIWSLFKNRTRTEGNDLFNDLFLSTDGRGPVRTWKLIGSFIVSALGMIVTFGIIVIHFDTILCPSFWLCNFRDGSKHEQLLLIILAIFWMIGLHVNTSSLSVGKSQPNVFFTSWISFVSAILNYGIWRVSAGRGSIAEMVNDHHRETTYNWLWVLFCNLIFAGAICDIYFNRNDIDLSMQGEDFNLPWIQVMCITWGLVIVSFVSIILNHFLRKSCKLRVFGRKGSFVIIGWRQAEGIVALLITGKIIFKDVADYICDDIIYNILHFLWFVKSQHSSPPPLS